MSKDVCTSVAALSNNTKTFKPFVQEKATHDTLKCLPGQGIDVVFRNEQR